MSNSRPLTENILLPHPAFEYASNRLEQCFFFATLKAEAEGVAIIGPSGSGKTSVLLTFLEQHPPTRDENGMNIPVVYASVPSSPTVKSLAGVILEALHASDSEKGTENEKNHRIKVLIRETGTRMLMLDEFQHFDDRRTRKYLHHVADWLKILMDQTRITVVIAGLPNCLGVIDQNEQLMRRFSSPVRLSRFNWQVPHEREQFLDILAAFHAELQKRYDAPEFHTEQMAFRFWQATNGLMGYLSKLLRHVERNALAEQRTIITLKDLHTAHMEAIWSPQRVRDLPKPFESPSLAPMTVDLLERVSQIGSVMEPPPTPRLKTRKTAKRKETELNGVLVRR